MSALRLRSDVHATVVQPGALIVVDPDGRSNVLSGRAFCEVLPLLDGSLSEGDIVMRLHNNVPSPEVYYALHQLQAQGWLIDAGESGRSVDTAFWHSIGEPAAAAADHLSEARISVVAIGSADSTAVAQALSGVAPIADHNATFSVVVTENYLDPALSDVNVRALDTGIPWLLMRPSGASIWLGPIFCPNETGCWQCLADRLRRNLQVEDYIVHHGARRELPATASAALPSTTSVAADLCAATVAVWLAKGAHELSGSMRTFDSVTFESTTHVLTRRPQCSVCGDPAIQSRPRVPQLASARKKFVADGGHRVMTPTETLARCNDLVSPVTGVVRSLVNFGQESNGLAYSFVASHNFSMGPESLEWLQRNLRILTGGKGMTEEQARASAIGEAVERYCGVFRGDEPTVKATQADLGEAAIGLDQLLHFSESQYRDRARLNAENCSLMHRVPNPPDPNIKLDWAPVWSLTDGLWRYVPASFAYFGHPDSVNHFFCAGDTNGCAAGNTLEEAILQAFFELVERDCVAIWWYNRLPRPGVDLGTIDMSYMSRLRQFYADAGRTLWVLDLTNDLGIPCFAALSARKPGSSEDSEDIVFGFGAHLDAQTALLRAVTELNQFLPAVSLKDGAGKTIYRWPEGEAVEWWRNATLASQPYLIPDAARPLRSFSSYEMLATDDIRTDVSSCVKMLEERKLEMLVLDLSQPDIVLRVCRVIVPGLRHFWRRLGPGRLYDVPVAQGDLVSPLQENLLNPVSVFV